MKLVAKIETWMADAFKDAPDLSVHNKETIVKVWPWVALIFGILQALAILSIWNAIRLVQEWSHYATYAPVYEFNQFNVVMAYVNIAILGVTAVLLIMAYTPLKMRARRGWELLFIVGLINAASAIVALFTYGQGIGSTLFSLLISAFIFYLLLQVREYYKGEGLSQGTRNKKSST